MSEKESVGCRLLFPCGDIRCLRNTKSRINTAFFVVKIKYLLKGYGKIELSINQSTIHLKGDIPI